ncbi:MAG TPA: prephenate dehydrogenase [Limnochordia bacterium]|jgi:prephenate dehydrogenase|nr:prephenate dehydrogenase [Bacillota bacterium]HOB09688.1 prephenate dehydrogenase [Limnochordia bacterium]NLH31812.1 prephenate dehydrogenase [Bacillota bacterium]HPT92966.1 prephenate dehydrogenase [Limnochordia bacterium]HPZ31616.1 prephenate dehydrogenase [Limnochordia bacterium]
MGGVFEQVVIIGVGLIGGSLGMAIRKHRLAKQVIGIDLDTQSLALAQDLGAVDMWDTEYTAVEDGDLVILAAPISANLEILEKISPLLAPQALITDVGSTKGEFISHAERMMAGRSMFVGGHPMAGAEAGGVRRADPYLFENAYYILTPTEKTAPQALAAMEELVKGIGAKPLFLDPQTHDLVVAAISHLPHLAAAALVQAAAAVDVEYPVTLALAAGGFKDTTRIASGDPALWREICFSNKEQIITMIDHFVGYLAAMRQALAGDREQEFVDQLAKAKAVRDQIPAKMKGYWPFLDEVIVTIPDRPGTIGEVAAILGGASINIDDIEILRVREGEGGSLRLGFAKPGAAAAAVRILKEQGYAAWLRNA